MTNKFDHIVVGAGVEGSATACTLAKAGMRTLLVEQLSTKGILLVNHTATIFQHKFPLPHNRGSSAGLTRILCNCADEPYVGWMHEARGKWQQLQNEYGVQLYRNSDFLRVSGRGGIKDEAALLEKHGITHELLSAEQLNDRFSPMKFTNTAETTWEGLLDCQGAIMFADRCLAAYQTLFTKSGGTLKDSETVTKIKPIGTCEVNIVTNKSTYTTKSLVLCTGPWTNTVLRSMDVPELPLKTAWADAPQLRLLLCKFSVTLTFSPKPRPTLHSYWRMTDPKCYQIDNFPCFEIDVDEERDVHGAPCCEYDGLIKVSQDAGGFYLDVDNRGIWEPELANQKQNTITASLWSTAQKFIAEHFPEVDYSEPALTVPCVLTYTPDRLAIVDRLPECPNVIVGLGMSGEGFGIAPIIAEILADLAIGRNPKRDISRLSIKRFDKRSDSEHESNAKL